MPENNGLLCEVSSDSSWDDVIEITYRTPFSLDSPELRVKRFIDNLLWLSSEWVCCCGRKTIANHEDDCWEIALKMDVRSNMFKAVHPVLQLCHNGGYAVSIQATFADCCREWTEELDAFDSPEDFYVGSIMTQEQTKRFVANAENWGSDMDYDAVTATLIAQGYDAVWSNSLIKALVSGVRVD